MAGCSTFAVYRSETAFGCNGGTLSQVDGCRGSTQHLGQQRHLHVGGTLTVPLSRGPIWEEKEAGSELVVDPVYSS